MKNISKFLTKALLGALLAISLTSFTSYASETAEETKDEKIERLTKEIEETVSIGPGAQIQLNEKRAELEALMATPSEAQPIEVMAMSSEAPVVFTTGNRWGVNLSPEEINLIARIGELECGGESDLGQQAVFEVILNRVASPEWPNTVHGVLSQKGQFTTWKNVNSRRAAPSDRIMNNLNIVLNGGSNIFPSYTVYFSRGPQNKRIQAHIGDHYFCNR